MFRTIIEPFRIKTVEPISITTKSQRSKLLRQAHCNPFLLHSKDVIIDLLTDSGTSAMSMNQWSSIMLGDESYAGASSWQKFEKAVHNLTTMLHVLPTHQGRAAERILYGHLGGKGKLFISNTHFDTTRANIEYSGAQAIDCLTPEATDMNSDFHFKGNLDTDQLRKLIRQFGRKNIAAIILTVTNNTGGGQPVSMQNAKEVRKICDEFGLLLVLDACRVAENSYFIRHFEKGFEKKSYYAIAQQMCSLADACIMSTKKDGLANIGGFLAIKDDTLAAACTNLLIITEGFTTYGGLTGRDMEAIAIGLHEVFEDDYLNYRIKSTAYLGNHLHEIGIPLMHPIGGHAVYVDAKEFYPHIPVENYPGQALVCELYLEGGIRCVEIGSVMFGKYNRNGKLILADKELVRLALPRRVYTQSHIDYVVEVFENVFKKRKKARGFTITYEPEFLRHFTAHFRPV
ncbi:MAG TPA: tryptophanase [Chitinophagales bacterium]|nr:tryptophanase [Chitinophagales bacterium]